MLGITQTGLISIHKSAPAALAGTGVAPKQSCCRRIAPWSFSMFLLCTDRAICRANLPPIKGYGGLLCLFVLVCATCGCKSTMADNK
jgi:hypothetical protein